MNAKRIYRRHEKDYRNELASIREEIEFLLEFVRESPSHRTVSPAVVDLLEREALIERALRRPVLPPMPYKLRNPFDRPFSNAKAECVRKLVKKY